MRVQNCHGSLPLSVLGLLYCKYVPGADSTCTSFYKNNLIKDLDRYDFEGYSMLLK
jgi:hypothetical protein